MQNLTLLFVGDVILGRGVNAVLRDEAADYPWGNTLSIFRSADLRIINLECAIPPRFTVAREGISLPLGCPQYRRT